MADRVWDRFLTAADRAHVAASPPRPRHGFGRRAAVLSVDNYRDGIGDRPEPLLDAIRTWPRSTGPAGWEALDRIAVLLAAARSAGVPVIHVAGLPAEESGMANWRTRGVTGPGTPAVTAAGPAEADRRRRRYDIVEQAAPLPGEVVLRKTAPSAFFGTPLAAHLIGEGIDTLIVCGQAVSGCVRASVVDGCSLRLRMIVVEECVYDRHEATRAMNLFDIDQKYGDVISLAETLTWLGNRGDAVTTGPRQHGHHHGTSPDHEHGHDHGHGHEPAGTMEIPREALGSLPAGAVPVSTTSQAISGHVLARAGDEVVDAVAEQMAGAFGATPHVIVALRAEQVTDRPDLHDAIARTEGGVLVVGVGYRPPAEPVATERAEPVERAEPAERAPEPCPECGAPTDDTVHERRPDGSAVTLLLCAECGAAWEI